MATELLRTYGVFAPETETRSGEMPNLATQQSEQLLSPRLVSLGMSREIYKKNY
jgi:hypothetical protein